VTVKDMKDGTAEVELPKDVFQVDAETGALKLKGQVKEVDGVKVPVEIEVDSVKVPVEVEVPGGKLAGIQKSITLAEGYQAELATIVKNFAQANGMATDDSKLFKADAAFTIDSLQVNKSATVTIADK